MYRFFWGTLYNIGKKLTEIWSYRKNYIRTTPKENHKMHLTYINCDWRLDWYNLEKLKMLSPWEIYVVWVVKKVSEEVFWSTHRLTFNRIYSQN